MDYNRVYDGLFYYRDEDGWILYYRDEDGWVPSQDKIEAAMRGEVDEKIHTP